jgi:hypothetical protein
MSHPVYSLALPSRMGEKGNKKMVKKKRKTDEKPTRRHEEGI